MAATSAKTGAPLWYGGGGLAADLTLPQLRAAWSRRTHGAGWKPSTPRWAGSEREALYRHAARQAATAAEHIRRSARGYPTGAADTAWAAADALHSAARVGQHVFARQVLANCGSRCVFCGLRPASFGATRMLLAGHIKPWKDSSPAERLDPCNGLAACPAHDVDFDTGMLTVNGGLRIHLARQLADAIQADPLARQYYGKPPLREAIILPEGAQVPARKYLDWHR